MADQKRGFNPSRQKVNPSGKYNEKKWVKLGKRDMVDIDEANSAIYNNTDIWEVYKKTENIYSRKSDTIGKVGRPKKITNE